MDEEKCILAKINKQVFIIVTKNYIINDRIIDRKSLLRNFNKLFKIYIKIEMFEKEEIKSLADIVDMWDI